MRKVRVDRLVTAVVKTAVGIALDESLVLAIDGVRETVEIPVVSACLELGLMVCVVATDKDAGNALLDDTEDPMVDDRSSDRSSDLSFADAARHQNGNERSERDGSGRDYHPHRVNMVRSSPPVLPVPPRQSHVSAHHGQELGLTVVSPRT